MIRRLTVCWNSVEAGAAGLADSDFIELVDADDQLLDLVDMFLSTAKIKSWSGRVDNPFGAKAVTGEMMEVCLNDVPDADVARILRAGEPFDLKPDDDLLALWAEANLRGEGIDPKRPFGSGNVSGDVRAIIDPDKTLSNVAFSKRRKTLESQLMFMLLRFVQAADLPEGTYVRDEHWQWLPQSKAGSGPGEDISHEEWVTRLYPGQIYQTRDYIKTLMAARHLMWEGRLQGNYTEVTTAMKLGNFYGIAEYTHSEVSIEEVLRLGLEHFGETELKPLTRMMVRVLNSQSRFDEALALLAQRDAVPQQTVRCRDGITPDLVFQSEAALARMGQQMQKTGMYLDALPVQDLPGLQWGWLYDILRADPRELAPEADHLALHMQAVAAQLQFMRGPYTP